MKTIGLIGGISWVSTIDYYRIINKTVNERLGGNETAKIILHSVNYGEIVKHTHAGDWDSITQIVAVAARNLVKSGADCVVLCANTMHQIADRIQDAIAVPLIHIAEVTSEAVKEAGLDRVLLLGTKYTMKADFYPQKLAAKGIQMDVPGSNDIEFVNDSIYNEMGKGVFLPATKKSYLTIMEQAIRAGAKGVILGCTEIPLLVKQEDCAFPVFDTTMLHATAAVDFALNG